MLRAARFTPLLLLLAAAPASRPGSEAVDGLITRLADADPAVRLHASDTLKSLGDAARPALRLAAHDPRPAVAEAAADLLLNGEWWDPKHDAQSIHNVLMRYGARPPDERMALIQTLIDPKLNLPNYRNVACRVLAADPADEVAWATVAGFFDFNSPERRKTDAEWEAALEKIDAADRPPALTLLLALCRDVRGDDAGALAACRRVLDQERERPTTSGRSLDWAVEQVVRDDTAAGRYADAASRMREQFARSDDQSTSQPTLIGNLLNLQARHGPLPELAADVRAAGPDREDHTGLSLAVLAGRAGLGLTRDLMIAAAVADRPRETDAERVDRLMDAGDTLAELGQPAAALDVFQRVSVIDADVVRGKIPLAFDRMSQIHAAAGDLQQAGDDLQRAIDHQNGSQLSRRRLRNGPYEPWLLEDEQAQCYWYWLRAAQARHDDAGAAEQVRRIIASGARDSGVFLEILPAIEATAKQDEVDAYFDRVFDTSKARLDADPENPTELNDLAWLCARSNRKLTEALAWSTQAVKLAPLQSPFLDTLAEVTFRLGDARTAATLEEKALATHSDDEAFMRGQLERFRAAAATQPATTQPAPTTAP